VEIGRAGIWSWELRAGAPAEAADAVAELEELGYGAVWVPAGGDGAFEVVGGLLDATRRIAVATGIVSIWHYEPAATAAAQALLAAAHPGRFVLGLGVSHPFLVDGEEPGRWRRPVEKMERYLDALDAAPTPVPARERVLAALGPRMLALARTRAAGAHPYLVTPEHTFEARTVLGVDSLLAVEQGVILDTDPTRARQHARDHLRIYLRTPNYINNWRRLGFGDDDLAGGLSDRLVDALIVFGDLEAVARRVQAHRDAGADHVCVQVIGASPAGLPRPEWRRLATVLVG
jgi:probable F420-dependent oxidoreductase